MYTKFQEIIFIRAKVVPFAVFPFDIIYSLLFIRCFNMEPARIERSILVLSGNFMTPTNAISYSEIVELLSSLNDE